MSCEARTSNGRYNTAICRSAIDQIERYRTKRTSLSSIAGAVVFLKIIHVSNWPKAAKAPDSCPPRTRLPASRRLELSLYSPEDSPPDAALMSNPHASQHPSLTAPLRSAAGLKSLLQPQNPGVRVAGTQIIQRYHTSHSV